MNTRRQTLTIVLVAALVVSGIGPFMYLSPVSTAQADSTSTYSYDFENESADAGIPEDWEVSKNEPANANVTDSTAWSGSQSMYADEASDGSIGEIRPSKQPYLATTSNVSFAVREMADGESPTIVRGELEYEGTNVLEVGMNEGDLTYNDGAGTITSTPDAGDWVHVEIYNIDPESETYDVKWETGSDSGISEDLPFENSAPGYTEAVAAFNKGGGFVDDFEIEEATPSLGEWNSGQTINTEGTHRDPVFIYNEDSDSGYDYQLLVNDYDDGHSDLAQTNDVSNWSKTHEAVYSVKFSDVYVKDGTYYGITVNDWFYSGPSITEMTNESKQAKFDNFGESAFYEEDGDWYIVTNGNESWDGSPVSNENQLYKSDSWDGPYEKVGTMANRDGDSWGTGDPYLIKYNDIYHLFADKSSSHPDYQVAYWTSDTLSGNESDWTYQGEASPDAGGDPQLIYNGSEWISTREYATTDGNDIRQNVIDTPPQTSTFSSGSSINGTVINQNGEPVENATVEAWGYAAPTYSEAKDELSTLSDPIPGEFTEQINTNFQLEGSTGYLADQENDYAAVFSTGDWPSGLTFDDPDLSPKWREVNPGEKIVLTTWDPTSPRTGGIDEELAGQTTDTSFVIEQLDGTGDVVDRQTKQLNKKYSTADFTWPPTKTHRYTKTTLDTGIYRIYAQGNEQSAYLIKVGDPKPTLDDTLEDVNETLSDQAQAIEDKISTGDVVREKTTTDEDGTFTVDVPADAKGVQVQAYKKPDELTSVDAQSATLSDLREFADSDYNGSFVLPSDIKRVDPPESDVEISVVEAETPTYSGLGEYENLSAWLNDQIDDLSYEELGDTLQQRLEDLNREELEKLNQDLEQIVNQNEELRNQLNETTINESDLTDEELRDRIGELEQTIDGLRNTIEEGDEEFSQDGETITWRKQFETEIEEEDVLVLVHYTNATTDTLTTDSEYVSVDSQLGQGDAVVVENLPLGDAAGAALEVVVANEDGTGSATRQVQNPAFDGEVPGLSSVSFSSLNPGASETVTVQLNPDDDSTIANVSESTVYGPDGSTINPAIDGTKATFETSGAGIYDVRFTFADQEGNEYKLGQKVKAGETDLKLPPGIRAEETPFGTVAIVGDGLEDGNVEVRDGGSEVRLVAQIAKNADAPQRVDANTETLSLLDNHKTSVSIVRGEDEESVDKNVRVVLKEPALDTDSQGITNFPPQVYRNGEPFPEGESSDGIVDLNESTARIETYTDTTGTVEIRTIENPSVTQWVRYQVDTVDVPSMADLLATVIVAP